MASSTDPWMKEHNEAAKLAEDINGMIAERSSFPASGPDTQRHASAIRRKITILGTRLDSLQSLLTKLPGKQKMWVSSSYLQLNPTWFWCFVYANHLLSYCMSSYLHSCFYFVPGCYLMAWFFSFNSFKSVVLLYLCAFSGFNFVSLLLVESVHPLSCWSIHMSLDSLNVAKSPEFILKCWCTAVSCFLHYLVIAYHIFFFFKINEHVGYCCGKFMSWVVLLCPKGFRLERTNIWKEKREVLTAQISLITVCSTNLLLGLAHDMFSSLYEMFPL